MHALKRVAGTGRRDCWEGRVRSGVFGGGGVYGLVVPSWRFDK